LPELPPEIGCFYNLTELTLNNCLEFTFSTDEDTPQKFFPSGLGKLKKLKFLDLGQNAKMNPPCEISELQELETLSISSSQLTDFPTGVCELKKLRSLILDNNSFTSLPCSIGNLTELTELDLSYSKLIELPPEIGKLKKLETLTIGGNPIASLPDEMKFLSKLKTLNLHDHHLTGFPSVLKGLKNLSDMEADFSPWIPEDVITEVLHEVFAEEIHAIDDRFKVLPIESAYPKAVTVYKNRILCSTAEKILLWNSDTLELIWEDDIFEVRLLSFSPNGSFFICVAESGFIRRYNVFPSYAELVWETETEGMPVALCVSKDSKSFAVCHQDMAGLLWLRNCSDGSVKIKFGDTEEDGAYEGYGYSSLSFSADGKNIYAADQDWSRVRCWVSKTGKSLPPLEEEGVQFSSIDVSADGKYIFTGTVETPGAVWDIENKQKVMSLEDTMGMSRIVSSHPTDSSVLATATSDVISVWNIETQEKTTEFCFQKEDHSVNTLSFSEENFLAALVSYQGYEEQKKGSSHIVLAYLS
jgi:WD40 repeat protein